MELLNGLQQQQHGAVVDGQRLGCIAAPVGAFGPTFEEGETVGIEQRAAQGWQAQVFMLDTAEHRTEDRQQARPSVPAALKDFFGFLAQLHAQGGERVVGLVAFVAHQQQATLLGGKQEHQTHHHRERGLVQLAFLDVVQ